MKHPNGYGSVSKMSGKRRRPYMVQITTGYTVDPVLHTAKQLRQVLGYYATRAEALQALADYNKDPFGPDLLRVTFRQCYEEASKSFSPGRAHNYRSGARYLEPIMDLPIRSIKASQMQRCIDSCQTTQQREIKTVCRKVYEYAMQAEIVDKDPALYLRSNTVETEIERDVFTPEQIRDLFDHRSDWWARVALILLHTGMRTKELQDLTAEDIDLTERIIHIRKAKNKSSVRDIPIHDDILRLCADYQKDPCCLTHNALNKQLKKRYGRLAHDCRHTFTTRMRECGVDLLVLQILLGHTPQTITERVYTHISKEEMREAIGCLRY